LWAEREGEKNRSRRECDGEKLNRKKGEEKESEEKVKAIVEKRRERGE
jgi:hypothetical protein